MEKLKEKHNHHATNCLKIILFTLVMLAPLLAVLVECMIAIYNPNATNTSNTFYTAINTMTNNAMFSWTQNTAIYSGLNAMLVGFEINSGLHVIATLLTYWALMTAIYIVFDIIIFIFTKLTHLLQ